jgi:hypothetical protein
LTGALLPFTVPEIRHLLWALGQASPDRWSAILGWSDWRRRHQAIARRCHYRRRLARYRA